jgi:hypothetical protein
LALGAALDHQPSFGFVAGKLSLIRCPFAILINSPPSSIAAERGAAKPAGDRALSGLD